MIKGISRQVIVVQSIDKKLFEQAIFIMSEEAVASGEYTDDSLLKEAGRLIKAQPKSRRYSRFAYLFSGAVFTGLIWFFTLIL